MLKTAKVVGYNSDTEAALAQVFPSASSGLVFAAVISVISDDAFTRARQSISQASESFYLSSLPVGERVKEIFDTLLSVFKDAEDLQLLLGVSQEDEGGSVFYLLHQGERMVASLLRDETKTDLCQLGENGELVSGLIEKGDRIILSSQSFQELLGEKDQLELPLESIEDEVVSKLSEEHFSPMAAVILEKEMEVEAENEETKPLEVPSTVKTSPLSLLKRVLGSAKLVFPAFIPRSKRSMLFLGIICLVVAIIGTGFAYKRQKDQEITLRFNTNLQKAQSMYAQADSLKDLNPKEAVESLGQAQEALNEALKIIPQDSQALKLKTELEGKAGEISKSFTVSETPLWLDLELIKKNFSSQSLSLSHGKLLLLDSDQNVLLQVNLANKSPQILGGEEKLGEGKLSSLNGDKAWVFSEDKGLVQVDTGNVQAKMAIKFDDEWGEIAGIYGFAGNIYLLDKGNNQIWKYLPIASGYSEKREYLQKDVKADFSGARKMEIDSSIWILKSGGEILKFTQGNPDNFPLSGLNEPVNNPQSFYVSDETDNLYLLENNRLLVVDKNGAYKTEYRSDIFKDFVDLVVDEKGKRVYFLQGSKILVMDLR